MRPRLTTWSPLSPPLLMSLSLRGVTIALLNPFLIFCFCFFLLLCKIGQSFTTSLVIYKPKQRPLLDSLSLETSLPFEDLSFLFGLFYRIVGGQISFTWTSFSSAKNHGDGFLIFITWLIFQRVEIFTCLKCHSLLFWNLCFIFFNMNFLRKKFSKKIIFGASSIAVTLGPQLLVGIPKNFSNHPVIVVGLAKRLNFVGYCNTQILITTFILR